MAQDACDSYVWPILQAIRQKSRQDRERKYGEDRNAYNVSLRVIHTVVLKSSTLFTSYSIATSKL